MIKRRAETLFVSMAIPAVLVLLALLAWEDAEFARNQLGLYQEETEEGLMVRIASPGEPAALAGLQAGDLLIRVNGEPVMKADDLRALKKEMARGQLIDFEASREGKIFRGQIRPGVGFPFFDFAVIAFASLSHLLLGPIAIFRRPGYLSARLLLVLTTAVAAELALPGLRTFPYVWVTIGALLNGLQMSTELHLASVIPEKQSWHDRFPWGIPAFYVLGLGTAVAMAVYYALEGFGVALPIPADGFARRMQSVLFPIWLGGVLLLLTIQAFRYPETRGRQQAAIVALGVVPWALLTLLEMSPYFDRLVSLRWQDLVFNLALLCYPLAVVVILFREARYQEMTLANLTDEVQRLSSVKEISPVVGEGLQAAFHPSSTHVFYRERHTRDLTLGHSTIMDLEQHRIHEDSPLLRLAEGFGRAIDHPAETLGLSPKEEAWLNRLEASLIVPQVGRDRRLVGLLVLGSKKSLEPYTLRDRRLLQALANQIGLLYENIRLTQRVDQSQQVQREVLTRLAEEEIELVKECPKCRRCFDATLTQCPDDRGELALSTPVERTIMGRYRLDRLIGRGGMGAIYEAHDEQLARTVAVKVLLQSALFASQGALQRFQREAQLTARLRHPNIVAAHDYGTTHTGAAFLVTEMLSGQNLQQCIQESGKIDAPILADWLDQALAGLASAHHALVIHRDLKPANIFIAQDDEGPDQVKILDFGIAKALLPGPEDENLTATGSLLGTFTYMAPEQLAGKEADERSDIFSLGVIAVEALTGSRPFRGDSPMEIQTAIAKGEIQLGESSPEARHLKRIMKRCLALEPDDRPSSAEKLRQELVPALENLSRLGEN